MIEHAREQIREAIYRAHNPVVLSSFGKDSTLLLALAREVIPDIPILYFREKISPMAKTIITDWDLTVFGYQPADRYLIPWGDDLALVDEISLGSTYVPLIRDVVLSDECQVEHLSLIRTPRFHYGYDLTLWGFKKYDELHPSMPAPFNGDYQLGSTRMFAPLYDWSDENVRQSLRDLKIDYEEHDDTMSMCAHCFEALKDWDRAAALAAFERRFGYAKAA